MDAAVRRNFSLGIIHESTWGAAMGLVNPFTILPLAAHALGRSVADAGLMCDQCRGHGSLRPLKEFEIVRN